MARAAEADPTDAAARLSLGYALLEQQLFDQAADSLREVLRLQPNQHEAHFLLGRAERAAGRLEEAVQCHARALQCDPGFDLALVEWGRVCLELGQRCLNEGQPEAARGWFEQVVTRRPDDAAAHAHLGLAWESLGNMDAAEDRYRRALVLQPGDPQASFGAGQRLHAPPGPRRGLGAVRGRARAHPGPCAGPEQPGPGPARRGALRAGHGATSTTAAR